ncbi:MAG: hypothetical protein ACTSXP_00075 [Promethearchaeota archaeon]
MSFYKISPNSDELRFGDVVTGYISTVPVIEKPCSNIEFQFAIDSSFQKFCVILTPCCQIGKAEPKSILLTPLKEIPSRMFSSDYLCEDISRINLEFKPIKAIPENKIVDLDEAERIMIESKEKQYNFNSRFVYLSHDCFPPYNVRKNGENVEIRDYMIDFHLLYHIQCKYIQKNKISQDILNSKCIELTPEIRRQLHEKMAFFFGELTNEDKSELGIEV